MTYVGTRKTTKPTRNHQGHDVIRQRHRSNEPQRRRNRIHLAHRCVGVSPTNEDVSCHPRRRKQNEADNAERRDSEYSSEHDPGDEDKVSDDDECPVCAWKRFTPRSNVRLPSRPRTVVPSHTHHDQHQDRHHGDGRYDEYESYHDSIIVAPETRLEGCSPRLHQMFARSSLGRQTDAAGNSAFYDSDHGQGRLGADPVARLQEQARWSSFTTSLTRIRVVGGPRWARRFIIIAVLLILTLPAVLGLIGLLVGRDERVEPRPFPSECRPEHGCIKFKQLPTLSPMA